jgi:hypothetical protein
MRTDVGSWIAVALLSASGCIDVDDLVFDGNGPTGAGGGAGGDTSSSGGGTAGGAAGGLGGSLGSAYVDVVMQDGPLAYWRVGEGEGTSIAADASGNGHDALYVLPDAGGGIVRGEPGAIVGDSDASVRVSDGASIIRDPHPFLFPGLAPYSFEAWVWVHESPLPAFVLSCPSGFGSVGYETQIRADSIIHERHAEPNLLDKLFLDTLFTSQFRHVVVTFDGSDAWLYIDALPSTPSPTPFLVSIEPHANPFHVVETLDEVSLSIDELAVYDHALPLERVEAHFRCGSAGEC